MTPEISAFPCPFHSGKICDRNCQTFDKIAEGYRNQPTYLISKLPAVIARWIRQGSYDEEQKAIAKTYRMLLPEVAAKCQHEKKM